MGELKNVKKAGNRQCITEEVNSSRAQKKEKANRYILWNEEY